MSTANFLRCDGCGRLASSEHISKHLQRLEWTTRYRPIHIGTLFLGAVAPRSDSEFLYSPEGAFAGQAGIILAAAGVSTAGKSAETALAEFQRGGFLLAYVLECPVEQGGSDVHSIQALLRERFPAALTRVRRSLKPKRLVPISHKLEPMFAPLEQLDLACSILLDGGKPFALDGDSTDPATRLRLSLEAVGSAASR